MKWRRRSVVLAVLLSLVAVGGDLSDWVKNVESASPLREAFFHTLWMPSGQVWVRRPPRETRPALSRMIAQAPSDANLLALRAREAEQQLDFEAAEADWKKYAQLASDYLALADFYQRRLRPADEIQALAVVARAPAGEPRAAFERIFTVIEAHALPAEVAAAQYRAWIARSPGEPAVQVRFFEFLLGQKRFAEAEQQVAAHQKSFPEDQVFPVRARASLAYRRGSAAEALAVYDRSFRPLWPPELVKSYFDLLKETGRLRDFLDRARSGGDLHSAARIFYYYQQQGNLAAAGRALAEYRLRKESGQEAWRAEELLTLGRLSEGIHDYNEAARSYYALYCLPGGDAEKALTGLIGVLLGAPEQPIRFGSGDLSFYRDVATMDPYPGFLNGILSLVLNSTEPQAQYVAQNQQSVAYFHRAKAAELLALFDSRFPKAPEREMLHAALLEAYATYGANEGVIRRGRDFLAAFPRSRQRTRVALLLADAYARTDRTADEFAVYDSVLQELSTASGGLPLRSPDYARVLDRYLARLVALKRIPDALALYRREIDRNAKEPGLYERLAAFLEQNRLGAQVEQVYRRAMQQFPDRSWHHRLARWYLRGRQAAAFEQLSREVIRIFSGSELEAYFREVVGGQPLDAALYRQLNLFAHERFPHNLTFVRNLLAAYSRKETYNPAAWEKLLREHWFFTDDLRSRFYEHLSRTGRLAAEVQAVSPQPAASWAGSAGIHFRAEAEAWQSHFERAAPLLQTLAADFPGDVPLGQRAAAVHRSLGRPEAAIAIEESLGRYQPGDRGTLTLLGEIHADRERWTQARPYWDRIAQVEPGKREGYLEAATVYWDYFQFDDALRQINAARQKFSDPVLFAYEAGAIFEAKRDYSRAVEEYLRGALSGASSPARSRLLQLARRPAHRSLADDLTFQAASGASPPAAAVALRVAVLEAQDRRTDLEKFLAELSANTSSRELLELADQVAERLGYPAVRERSLERCIATTADRVERLRLRLALMRLFEGRHEVDRARQVVEALYNDHPNILGVVRAAADFYWRNKMGARAVDVLVRAAGASHPDLQRQFTLEAANKAAESGEYERAHSLLAPLLQAEPSHADYLAAMANTYARASDDRGLHDFYQDRLKALRDASPAVVAGLRRGLIPALDRMQDYAGALDQYIEIINRFPEDEALVQEAALYAVRNRRQQQLRAYYTKAAADSPRDFRWPMVLARLETHFEDYPSAIAAYGRATGLRPDRTDLHAARAALEERLMRFDDAARSYAQLYDLTYQTPHWMEKVAEVRARQRQADAAVAALQRALIEGRPERPEIFFETARRLESWNLLPQARGFARRGVELAGKELLVDQVPGAQVYARILTRLRAYQEAYAQLTKAPSGDGLALALTSLGETVALYYSPQEQAAFAAFLEKQETAATTEILLALARSSGLGELEARWRYEILMAAPGTPQSQAQYQPLVALQRQRMRFEELGGQLEAYWKALPKTGAEAVVLDQAAESYQAAGNDEAELRVLAGRYQYYGLSDNPRDRFFGLLLVRDPQRLVALAAREYAAAEYAIARGDAALARQAVAARGRALPAVWTRAYTALAGVHQADRDPAVRSAFLAALGTGTIGERVGKPVNRDEQMAGSTWFYFGSRYGEYLAAQKLGNPEDYLPAVLEVSPGRPGAYFQLAEFYRESGEAARALADYDRVLELDPLRGEAHDREAVILWSQGKRPEAVARWREALVAFDRLQNTRRLSPEFWENVRVALENVGARRQLPEVRTEADRLLRTYIRRNGSYQVEPLLEGALTAAGDPAEGVAWLLDLARSTNTLAFLEGIVEESWLPAAQKEVVLSRIIETAQGQAAQAHGEAQVWAAETLRRWQLRMVQHLVDAKQTRRATAALAQLPARPDTIPLEIRVAALAGGLDALLARYRREPEKASLDLMRSGAFALNKSGDAAAARQVLEFVYTRELEQRNFAAANFLGFAELKLESGDLGSAVALLRRMTLVSGEPFEHLNDAAALLEQHGRRNEAVEFRASRLRAVPWDVTPPDPAAADLAAARRAADPSARLRLLLDAVAARPGSRELRLATFHAALDARGSALAVSAMEPLIEASGLRYLLRSERPEEAHYASEQFPYGKDVARLLAEACEKLGRLPQAGLFYRIAGLDAKVEAVAAQRRLRSANALRSPRVTQNIEQANLVRPRLKGAAAP